jgi:hypothetical protein
MRIAIRKTVQVLSVFNCFVNHKLKRLLGSTYLTPDADCMTQ